MSIPCVPWLWRASMCRADRVLFRRLLAEATRRAAQDGPNAGEARSRAAGRSGPAPPGGTRRPSNRFGPGRWHKEQLWLVQGAGYPAFIYPDRRTGTNAFAVRYSDRAMMLAMARLPQWLMLVSQPVIPSRSAIC